MPDFPPQSPITNSALSPNTLPAVGYSVDQLEAYIRRQLGQPVFMVEITKQQVLDGIQDALTLYNQWRPRIKYGSIALASGQHEYLQGVDLDLGPISVEFLQRRMLGGAGLFFWGGNLIDVAPLVADGMGEYDMFLRWQKMFMRVTSVKPDWVYDQTTKTLLIYNPSPQWLCGIQAYIPYCDVSQLDRYGADWVKKYAFQKSRLAYAEIMNKYSGAIPGPVRDLVLDQNKRDKAETQIEKLEQTLFNAQISTPMSID